MLKPEVEGAMWAGGGGEIRVRLEDCHVGRKRMWGCHVPLMSVQVDDDSGCLSSLVGGVARV